MYHAAAMDALSPASPDRPLIWAHRGASADAPENTLPAFQLAAAQGADGVELDAQLCGSGEVVVLHDTTLGRTTGLPALLAETSWRALRSLDAGLHKGSRWAGTRVPLLAEVLEATQPSLRVNIELKCEAVDDRGLVGRVCNTVREAHAGPRVLLSSFNPLCLFRARAVAPELPRALLFEPDQPPWLAHGRLAPLLGVRALHPEACLASPAAVRWWLRRGYCVGCWTVDDPTRATELWALGAAGLITNTPSTIKAAFAGREGGPTL